MMKGMRKKKKEKIEECQGRSFHGGATLLLWVGLASSVIEDGGGSPRCATFRVVAEACHPPSYGMRRACIGNPRVSRRASYVA